MAIFGLVLWMLTSSNDPKKLTLTELQTAAEHHEVSSAKVFHKSNKVEGTLADDSKFTSVIPHEYSDELTKSLLESGVDVSADNEDSSALSTFATDFLPTLILVGVFIYFAMMMQGGGRAGRFGQSKAKQQKAGGDVTFADVAGTDEAVEELQEIKDFLMDPQRFALLGAKIPSGVLLMGPPGTGKTLLARAVAGEAGVPFFTISGSDFVEMFVGVGAARVRDLFKQAKAAAPAIIFVDEIDAVGRHRGAGVGGGHDEREQTLNQLLVEMDGFDMTTGVILMAATNRPDVLDPALLRPGRFDRHIVVDAPDLVGRLAILKVHARAKPMDDSVDLAVLARRTPGFTGADLANVLNEAALLCGRRRANHITGADINESIDRVMAGPERKSRVMSDHEKSVTAYHEAGHALVGHLTPHADPIHKVSIVARGRALGWTLSLPTEDRHTHTRSELIGRLEMMMGGRCAEALVFDEITTGASDDIDRATNLARAMVTEYGMSELIGPLHWGQRDDAPFLGRDGGAAANYSQAVATTIDEEVRRMVQNAHDAATAILVEYRADLDRLAQALIERETLDEDDLSDLLPNVEVTDGPSDGTGAD